MLLRLSLSVQNGLSSRQASLIRYFSSDIASTGAPVDVEWGGTWWNARIKESDTQGQRILVSYENWSSKWDEWVELGSSRIRNLSLSNIPAQFDVLAPGPVSTVDFPELSSVVNEVRTVIELSLNGSSFLSSTLRNGSTVLMDPLTGDLSWSLPKSVPNIKSAGKIVSKKVVAPQVSTSDDWIERRTQSGVPYYFNPLTLTSQFELPTVSVNVFAANMAKSDLRSDAYFTKDGVPYYQNAGEVSWHPQEGDDTPTISEVAADIPVPASQPVKQVEQVAKKKIKKPVPTLKEIAVPEGWEIHYADSGFPYYYCQATKTSHWELPAFTEENVAVPVVEVAASENWWEWPSRIEGAQKNGAEWTSRIDESGAAEPKKLLRTVKASDTQEDKSKQSKSITKSKTEIHAKVADIWGVNSSEVKAESSPVKKKSKKSDAKPNSAKPKKASKPASKKTEKDLGKKQVIVNSRTSD